MADKADEMPPPPGAGGAMCRRITVAEMIARYGADLAAGPDAQLALIVPAEDAPSPLVKATLKLAVLFVAGSLAALWTKSPMAMRFTSAFVIASGGDYLTNTMRGPIPEHVVGRRAGDHGA